MPSPRSKASDAISLLKSDHRKVESLFARYEKSKNSGVKAKLAREICLELSVHTTIEEEVFYPAIKFTVDPDINDEAYVEHDGAKALIAEIMAGTPDDEFYDAKVKVLSEQIKHHVKEEEQRGGMFAQAKDDGDVDLVAEMKTAGVPTPTTRSMKGVPLEHSTPVA